MKCDLRKCVFKGAKLSRAVFEKCDLREADFSGAETLGVDFGTSRIEKTVLDFDGFLNFGNLKGFVLADQEWFIDRPIRAVAILIKGNEVLLMHRRKQGEEYYTFPGGGVEDGETVMAATLRELEEETTIKARIKRLLYIHDYGEQKQYYYLCEHVAGKARLGDCVERGRMEKDKNCYEPLWVSLDHISQLLLYPLEIRDWLVEDLKRGFDKRPRRAVLKINDLQQVRF